MPTNDIKATRWYQFADASPDVLWIRDPATLQLDYVSPAYLAVYGMERDGEAIGDVRRWLHLILPEDRAGALDALRTLRLGEPVTHEFRIRRPSDAAIRWVRNTDFPLTDGAGLVTALGGIARDVTERRVAEAALLVSEVRFREFAEHSTDALWIADAATGHLEYLSPAFETMWGAPRGAVMADIAGWTHFLHPDDRERALASMPSLLGGEQETVEYRIVRPDGQVRWILDVGFPIKDQDGRITRVAGIAQDVTGRRRQEEAIRASERRFRSLSEGIPQLVWSAVDDGVWNWASPQWTAFTGLSKADSVGWGWQRAVHPHDRKATREAWDTARNTGTFEVRHRLRHAADGRYRWFQTRATPVRDEDGAVVEWLGTSTDIDDISRLQDHQQLLLAELQHRVRNTLAIVRSIARRTAETSETVEEFGAHLDGRLGSFARTQAALTRDPAAGVALRTIVTDELAAHAARENEHLRIEGPDLRLQPKAAETLTLAFHELTTNAVKYGALSQDGTLAITWRIETDDDRRLVICWTELLAAPTLTPPARRGFGTELLERTLNYELEAETRLSFPPTGLRCRIILPLTPGVEVVDRSPGERR